MALFLNIFALINKKTKQMKKIALLLSVLAFASCKNLADNQYEITGNVDASWEGRNVILERPGGMMGTTPVDTVKVEGGRFVFTDTVTAPDYYLISVDGVKEQKLDFVLEPGAIEITVDKDTLQKSKVGGTYNNDKLTEFKELSKGINKKFEVFAKVNKDKYMVAMQSNDTVTANKIMKEQKVIIAEADKKYVDFMKANTKAYYNLYILQNVAQMGVTKIEDAKKLYENFDASVKKTKRGKEVAEVFANYEKQQAEAQNPPEAAPAPEETAEPAAGPKVGDAAPQFSAPTATGKMLALKDAMGKVTIVDFWASWCQPCRAENPNVVAIYNKYHAKGLNIIGVSLDKTKDAWEKAIAADKLTWNHVSNLKFWQDPVAQLYAVNQIPTMYVLDANGKIVAKDLHGPALEAKIKELL